MIRTLVVTVLGMAVGSGCVDPGEGRGFGREETPVTEAGVKDADRLARSWRWNRRVVLATGSESDLTSQATMVGDHWTSWLERDLQLVLLTRGGGLVVERFVDGGPVGTTFDVAVETGLAARFDLEPAAGEDDRFQAVLVGKDGGVKHRWSAIVEPAEIFGLIDAMPMRIREMQEDDER